MESKYINLQDIRSICFELDFRLMSDTLLVCFMNRWNQDSR
jgi:hypothetical protein